MELTIIAVVVLGVAVLAGRRWRGRAATAVAVTGGGADTDVVPPRTPRQPLPGYRADRWSHGKP